MKKAVVLFLVLAFMLGVSCAHADPEDMYGQIFPDFSVNTIGGSAFTLSESLKTHDLVLINFWATWCGPCCMEFPFLEEAWEQYSDRVDVIALSVENDDTFEVVESFADEYDLKFPMGRDDSELFYGMDGSAIPTTLIVDKERQVVAVEIGMKSSTDEFTALFDDLLSAFSDQNKTRDRDHTTQTPKTTEAPEPDTTKVPAPDTNKGAAFGFDLTENELITINQNLYQDALKWTEDTVPQNLKDFPLIPAYLTYYEKQVELLDPSLEITGNKAVWTSDAESLYSGDYGIISCNLCYGFTQSYEDIDFVRTGTNTFESEDFQNASDVTYMVQERRWRSGDFEYSFSIDFSEADRKNGGRITFISMENMESGMRVFWQINSETNNQLYINVYLDNDDMDFSLEYDLDTGRLLSCD